mmetsp:Transcript_23018/g.63838  ORF Transcript_23018/g.63838 Transcript_23018/m.63838 type:complete len:103 (-) Transcript_23018:505-813(-)
MTMSASATVAQKASLQGTQKYPLPASMVDSLHQSAFCQPTSIHVAEVKHAKAATTDITADVRTSVRFFRQDQSTCRRSIETPLTRKVTHHIQDIEKAKMDMI